MGKLPNSRYFYKSFKDLLKGKLTAREVLIYGIIADFADTPQGCFISRAEIAKRINESEATAERALQVLISEGYVKAHRQGRKRYLCLTDLYQPDTGEPADLYQPDTSSVSKQGSDLYQLDTLVRSNTQIHLLRSNNQIQSNNNNNNNKSDNRSKYKYEMLWDETKQVMVRKRIAS